VKVQLREIPCHKTVELDPGFVGKALGGLPVRAALERPADDPDIGSGTAELDLYLEGRNVFARGHVAGSAQVACSRCLTATSVPIDEDIMVTFMPHGDVPADERDELPDGETEAAFEEDDVDVYPYEGEAVDLEPLLREQLVLAMPFAPLCREDCKGLCPVCGVDLNRETCGCDRRSGDPRLAALKDLKV
jgi:uncharacterized protein